MGVKKMARVKANAWILIIAVSLLVVTGYTTCGEAASVKKYVTPMEDGNYLVKLRVTASRAGIYAMCLIDPKAAIVDVYAPKGWCVVTDGGDYMARTGGSPIAPGKTVEFLIHSKTEEIQYTFSVFGKLEQIGKPGTI